MARSPSATPAASRPARPGDSATARRDGAWHDAQYNNRALVPDHAEYMARWAQASALSRARMTCLLDQPYGTHDSDKLDVFPARQDGSPVLVFIHGGYWRALDKSDHSFVAPAFVQAGAMVVVPNYALAPAVGIDHIALQMAHALAWVWLNAPRFGGDRQRIVVAGHSAGGHLAAMLLACDWPAWGRSLGVDLPPGLLTGGLSMSGLFDLEPVRQTPFLQSDLRLTPELVQRLSPAGFPAPAAPLHALVGADESSEFIRQNQLIRDRWGPRSVPVCATLAGHHHFSVLGDLVDPAGQAHASALQLLGLTS